MYMIVGVVFVDVCCDNCLMVVTWVINVGHLTITLPSRAYI